MNIRIHRRVTPILFLLALNPAFAATVRGRLQRTVQGGQVVPAGGIAVTLQKGQGSRSLAVTTDANGMYYLPDVGAGSYTLQVWSRPGAPPYSVPVEVREPRVDVNPLNLP